MNNEPKSVALRIASGATTSEAVKLIDFDKAGRTIENKYFTPKGIIFPATTGTSFTFEVSEDGQTFVQLRDTSNAALTITKTAGQGSAHPLYANDYAGWGYIRIVSGSTEAADRDIILKGYKV